MSVRVTRVLISPTLPRFCTSTHDAAIKAFFSEVVTKVMAFQKSSQLNGTLEVQLLFPDHVSAFKYYLDGKNHSSTVIENLGITLQIEDETAIYTFKIKDVRQIDLDVIVFHGEIKAQIEHNKPVQVTKAISYAIPGVREINAITQKKTAETIFDVDFVSRALEVALARLEYIKQHPQIMQFHGTNANGEYVLDFLIQDSNVDRKAKLVFQQIMFINGWVVTYDTEEETNAIFFTLSSPQWRKN